ncbi:hypothetical protein EDC94DRAFT_360680 [Helicostylum pulchrum]|nr:hypothetical protein EDC94DRAFT_360680 [Helicostylum pulchrum]
MSYYGGDRDRGDRDRSERGNDRTSGERGAERSGGAGGDRGRPNPCRLYVGKVSRYVREQDLKDLFSRFGRIRDLVLRDFYAFIEYDNVRDAEDASKELNGYRLEDERLIVQVANRARDRSERDNRDSRDNRDTRRDTRDTRDSRDSRRDTRDTRDFDRSDRTRRGTDTAAEPANDRCYNCGEFGHM